MSITIELQKIEKELGLVKEEIHDCLNMIHDSNYAQESEDKHYSWILYDLDKQKLLFKYVELEAKNVNI